MVRMADGFDGSTSPKRLGPPGPSQPQLEPILQAALRAPDHHDDSYVPMALTVDAGFPCTAGSNVGPSSSTVGFGRTR